MADRRNRASGSRGSSYAGSGGSGRTPRVDGQAITRREFVVIAAFAIAALIVFIRLFFLQVFKADEYSAKAQEARTTNIKSTPRRGTIYDRNGIVLATSVDATTIYVNPYEVTDVKGTAAKLAELLGGEVESYEGKLTQEDISFVYIKRAVDADLAEEVRALKLDGIYFISEPKRVYPNEQVGGQIIGACDPDGNGTAGLELYYEEILAGSAGTLVVERGAYGIPIAGGVKEETKAVDGQDIIISIDINMQQYLEERLQQGVADIGGESGNSVLMDASTGEIMACASLPYFNPADRSVVEEGATQIKSITDSFEPGSIFKTVTTSAILEEGILTPEDEIFCPSVLHVDGYEVSDAHARDDMTMTFRQILDQSSNVGISLAAEKLGFAELYEKILTYKFTEITGIDYPGESAGFLSEQNTWSTVQSYNVSFGQGISVTPLQMTRFYGAVANDGVACTPHFLMKKLNSDEAIEYASEDIIKNKESIETLKSMLRSVVTDGTGRDVAIEGYSLAGKTGTAEIANPAGGYQQGVYNISFIGFLSDTPTQLVCFVGATGVPGERKVTPAFRDIMAYAIDRYKIVPNEG